MSQANIRAAVRPVPLRSVALPSEHGGWSFLLEPLVLGLWVAGSPMGWVLAGAALCAFLVHQPLKIVLKDRLKGRRPPRTVLAERFLAGYTLGAIGLGGWVIAVEGFKFLLPLVLAAPFFVVQMVYDAHNHSRELIPEVCGAVALNSLACAVAMVGGLSFESAAIGWLILAGRSVPTIVYVRARLKAEHGKSLSALPSHLMHAAALAIGTLLGASIPVLLAYAVLWARAGIGLSCWRKPRPAKHIGMMEIGYGALIVACAGLG
jgi:hypothetical protein